MPSRISLFDPFDSEFNDRPWRRDMSSEPENEKQTPVKGSGAGKMEYEIGQYISDRVWGDGGTLPDGFQKITVTETTIPESPNKSYRANIMTKNGVAWSSWVDVVPDGYVFDPPLVDI